MNTQINQETCIGCGTCVALCPKYYRMNNDDTKAEVYGSMHHDISKNTLDESITMCPVGAISPITEDQPHTD